MACSIGVSGRLACRPMFRRRGCPAPVIMAVAVGPPILSTMNLNASIIDQRLTGIQDDIRSLAASELAIIKNC